MSKKLPRTAVYKDTAHNTPIKRTAFTLIELLVVIAIIAILAAILFPVFAQAREKARQTTCLSNQKQLGLGFMQYSQDFDETLPDVTIGMSVGGPWDRQITPYTSIRVTAGGTTSDATAVARAAIFHCPSDFILRQNISVPGSQIYTPRSYQTVRARGCIGASSGTPRGSSPGITGAGGMPLANISQVAGTLLLVEMPNSDNQAQYQFSPAADRPSNGFTGCGAQDFGPPGPNNTKYVGVGKTNHSGGWNYLFCDGHAKWHRPEQTVDSNLGDTLVGRVNGTAYGFWTIDDRD